MCDILSQNCLSLIFFSEVGKGQYAVNAKVYHKLYKEGDHYHHKISVPDQHYKHGVDFKLNEEGHGSYNGTEFTVSFAIKSL
nr:SAHS [Mesobiotus radiatus]